MAEKLLLLWKPDLTAQVCLVIQRQQSHIRKYGYTLESSDEDRAKRLYGRFMAYPPSYSGDVQPDWQRFRTTSAPFRSRCLLLDRSNWHVLDAQLATFVYPCDQIPRHLAFTFDGCSLLPVLKQLLVEPLWYFTCIASLRQEERIVIVKFIHQN